ncbi:molybdenum cofactor guanylyltransferase [Saliphagus infecundisoli]|uniref:Probable molybdenum cofactor guanylyltransferase n=1 Tax=Saliphagus infecundisoli TaxID=1849069 RepID=A0ABD5QL37_9EURY|nr:molybdenum cofactor guanylyltransferase [Saliphagus infecundisoli]
MTSSERTERTPRAAIVLAGGYSQRFGDGDKVFAELDGRPLLCHVVERVQPVTDTTVISCRDEQTPAIRSCLGDPTDVRIVPDPVTDCGPVAGIDAALTSCRADTVAVRAADEPFLDPQLLTFLFERLAESSTDCVIPRGFEGKLQPTQAVYQRDALIEASSPNKSLYAVVDQLDSDIVPSAAVERHADPCVFFDIDTPDDLERARLIQ